MKILRIEPKDLYITFEISFSNLCKLRKALDMAKIDFDGNVEEEVDSVNYLTNDFYSSISEVIRDIKGRRDGD